MKKKMIFALLLAGMSFATPSKVEAQETAKVAAASWRYYWAWVNVEFCAGSGGNCMDEVVVYP